MTESKYIIVKQFGKLRHIKFPSCYHHFYFARDNGFDYFRDVMETGLIVDKKITILECNNREHMKKRMEKTFLSEGYMKGRELETMLVYKLDLTPMDKVGD